MKNYIRDFNIDKKSEGIERQQELLDLIGDKSVYLPQGIHLRDMDKGFLEFVRKEYRVSFPDEINNDRVVPVYSVSIQKYNEFTKTWNYVDDDKNVSLPFILITRKLDIEQGSSQGGLFNIPGKRQYTYMKVPKYVNETKLSYDLYKIPQPTPVDLTYDVKFFGRRMSEMNKLSEITAQLYRAMQFYINVNGHYMATMLEGISDESQIDELESRKFYVQNYQIKLKGLLLDESEFEVHPTIDRMYITESIDEPKIDRFGFPILNTSYDGNSFETIIKIKRQTQYKVKFPIVNNFNITSFLADNISTFVIVDYDGNNYYPNNLPIYLPKGQDTVIKFTKLDNNKESTLSFQGNFN